MIENKGSLPEFGDPPVVEVAISVQFKPLDRLRSAHFGLIWSLLLKNGFTRTEDHGTIEPSMEEFGAPPRTAPAGVSVEMYSDAPPLPRVWFLNDRENELVQIQRDRLTVNWRQGASPEPYPRYASVIKRFREALGILAEFVRTEDLGVLAPTQCEVTYVNHILPGSVWSKHSDLDRVIATWRNEYSDSYLEAPEDAGFRVRYRMNDEQGNPIGRLHVMLHPAYRSADSLPILVLNLTGRGKPANADSDQVFSLLDREHEWIVRGFASLTSKQMHHLWRRRNDS
jgi:uncharacterized protein (TIGR04255 family)